MPQDAVRQDLGGPRGSARACSTSTCTWSTRSRARRPSTACAWPAARCAAPTARSRPPTTTCPPTARPMARADQGPALAACRSRRSSSNCAEFGVPVYSIGSDHQGIVHVIGPELGVTQPGMTIVCGDSHTATHGAFGALAFGIGTSEVEHVLATQTLVQRKPKSMRVRYEGELGFGVTAKDLILGTIGQMGVDGGVGHVIEYAGDVDRGALDGGPHDDLQHDDRGRRPRGHDRPRRDHVRVGRGPARPRPRTRRRDREWRELYTEDGATFDKEVVVDAAALVAAGHLGHDARDGRAGHRRRARAAATRATSARSSTWTSRPGTPIQEIKLDRVFIGSCTNSRIGDLRAAAEVDQGQQGRTRTSARWSCPGSQQVKLAGRGRGPRRGLQAPPASTGAAPAARCAWA